MEAEAGVDRPKMSTVNLHQKMTKWEWWSDSYCVHIFIFLLLEARKEQGFFQGFKIERGQVVAGRGVISTATGIAGQVIRTRMERMKKSGDLDWEIIEGERCYTVITIKNFDKYQDGTPVVHRAVRHTYTEDFETWWNEYKRGSKLNAFQAWCRQEKYLPPMPELIIKTNQYKEYCKQAERPMMDGQGWINQHYFESDWTHEVQGTQPEGSDHVKFG